jgi:16S rRNA (uracil1498-N3)-methyltransferase
VLSGRDYHYLTRVLRLSEGETLAAVSASGARYTMRIEQIGQSSCRVGILPDSSPRATDVPPDVGSGGAPVHLLQCLPKGSKMDLIVRQAVEAGVESIVPVVSGRSITGVSDSRLARWRRIAGEALQQSGNPRLPDIREPVSLAAAAALDRHGGIGLVFHQEKIADGSLHAVLAGESEGAGHGVYMLIGPEGGLTADEVGILKEAGFHPVHLGDTVLRTETAALYAIAAVKIILRERGTWTLSE